MKSKVSRLPGWLEEDSWTISRLRKVIGFGATKGVSKLSHFPHRERKKRLPRQAEKGRHLRENFIKLQADFTGILLLEKAVGRQSFFLTADSLPCVTRPASL